MKKLLLLVLCATLFVACKKEATPKALSTSDTTDAPTPPAEFADNKYSDIGKKMLAALSKNKMDDWTNSFAEDAKYYWNNGDSLVGKPAIDKYWRDRRANVIETITFEEEIWMPIKVNEKGNIPMDGIWLLSWHKTTAKYKGGATMKQWIHSTYHFNSDDKIDRVHQYLDRVPIMEAMPPKK